MLGAQLIVGSSGWELPLSGVLSLFFMVPHVYVRIEMSPDFPKTSSPCASFQKFLQRKAGLATSPGSSFLSSLPSAIRSVLTLRELCNTSVHVLCCLC